jgi:sugar-specific transcriptional regulator TrmB
MLEKYLEEIGLSDKEAAVYLALLQVENAAISAIAEKTKINRTTVYPVLQSLEKKGLASEVPVGKKIHYEAAPPERLESFVERQKVILEEHSARLKDIIPQIKSVSRETGERPIIKFFEGREGALSAYHEFYQLHDEKSKKGYFIFNRDLLEAHFSEKERASFVKIRTGKGVEPISVYNKNGGEHIFRTPGARVWIDEKKYPILCDITIIEDRVIISTVSGESVSILLKSNEVATTLASLVQFINDEKEGLKK